MDGQVAPDFSPFASPLQRRSRDSGKSSSLHHSIPNSPFRHSHPLTDLTQAHSRNNSSHANQDPFEDSAEESSSSAGMFRQSTAFGFHATPLLPKPNVSAFHSTGVLLKKQRRFHPVRTAPETPSKRVAIATGSHKTVPSPNETPVPSSSQVGTSPRRPPSTPTTPTYPGQSKALWRSLNRSAGGDHLPYRTPSRSARSHGHSLSPLGTRGQEPSSSLSHPVSLMDLLYQVCSFACHASHTHT
jgi:hypothetical protein